MRLKFFLFILLLIFSADCAFAQSGELTQSRILILLDGSSSMTEPWAGGKQKFKAASELIARLMDSAYAVNKDVEFSLRVFGHQHTVEENYCFDTKNEVPFAKDNRTRMALRLDAIHPLGVTPIAFALKEAAEQDLTDVANNAYSIILITDGGESCGGDICEVMRKLIKNKIIFRPYIVSLENDPKLRTTYSCMGDYLQVTTNDDVPVAVSTIVRAFRPVLKITTADYKNLQTTAAKATTPDKTPPVPRKDTIAKKPDTIVFTRPEPGSVVMRPPAETLMVITTMPLKPFTIYSEYNSANLNLHPFAIPSLPPLIMDTPAVVRTKDNISPIMMLSSKPVSISVEPAFIAHTVAFDEPVMKHEEVIAAMAPMRPRALNISIPPPAAQKHMETAIELPPVKIGQPESVREKAKIAKLKPAPQHSFNVFFVIEEHSYSLKPVPSLPAVKYDPSMTPKTPPAPPKENAAEYTTSTEDAKETTLQILFTNGKGKYYTTTPQVFLIDPKTKNVVKKFYRTVDANGNPDPQTGIPPGDYDLAFTPKKGLVAYGVHITAGKKTIYTVTVKNTTLSFAYSDARERPVKEYAAVVTERDKPQGGRVQNQKCTERIEYEPGNYHIMINTFPIDRRNVDLDFDAETVITIPQPGFAKFTAQADVKTVSLYQRLGDKFLNFYSLNLSDPRSQHLPIQPGEYQVHYQRPGVLKEEVVQFLIKSTQDTEVIIK